LVPAEAIDFTVQLHTAVIARAASQIELPIMNRWKERTFSLRYKRGDSPEAQMRQWQRRIESHGMTMVTHHREVVRLSATDIGQARLVLFVRQADAAVYEAKGIVQRRLRQIARPVRVQRTTLRAHDRSIEVILRVASSNSFPALGLDIWTARQLRLPAGFVTVRGRSEQSITSLASELRKEL
jgi:hypothetical protein